MCVSTVALCTLATLSSDASAGAIAPPSLAPPAETHAEAKSKPLITPIANVAPPEVNTLELSAPAIDAVEHSAPAISAIEQPTPEVNVVEPSTEIGFIERSAPEASSPERSDRASPQPRTGDWRLLAAAPSLPAIAPPESFPLPNPAQSQAETMTVTAPLPQPIYLENQPEFATTVAVLQGEGDRLAQAVESPPSAGEIQDLQESLRSFEADEVDEFGDLYEGSPAISIAVPSGYGADNFEGFVHFSYQTRTRGANQDDGTLGIGLGVGDAEEAVGLQLSYTIASFGENRDFGSGGFNAKLHRRLGDGWSAAIGWEGFLNIGDDNDFEDSVYGSVTHIARLSPDLDDPFSRIALTAGIGSGRFRTEDAIQDDDDTLGVFGSVAVRIARPVSAIVEWTGQDLALGLSIAPLPHVPWVITPALRDVAGAGDGARVVIGTGFSWQF